ncbi:MAG: TetR/AcrR family transcriptional regulator [Proteobacteria bacterium]|nr:TetR/AcrR family transcriptional regulator [Pseudomonadota bacterium]
MPVPVSRSKSDGRLRRSAESRAAIVNAMVALVREGNPAPSAEQVAIRGKVGLRSVFRHFKNMESLYREMNDIILAEILPLAERPFAAQNWRGRLDELIVRRADIFERILRLKTAAEATRSKFIEDEARRFVAYQRNGVSALLPAALRKSKLEALDLAFSFETWRRLRREQRLSPVKAKAVVSAIVASLVD